MRQNQKHCEKKEKPIESFWNIHSFGENLEHFVFLSHDFDHPEKPGQLHKFVKSTESGESNKPVYIRCLGRGSLQNMIKWEDCWDIDCKPTLNIIFSNLFSVINFIEILVVESWKETENEVNSEKGVHDNESNLPFVGVLPYECNSVGDQHAWIQQQSRYKYVPVFFCLVVLIYQAKFPLFLLVCIFEFKILFGN